MFVAGRSVANDIAASVGTWPGTSMTRDFPRGRCHVSEPTLYFVTCSATMRSRSAAARRAQVAVKRLCGQERFQVGWAGGIEMDALPIHDPGKRTNQIDTQADGPQESVLKAQYRDGRRQVCRERRHAPGHDPCVGRQDMRLVQSHEFAARESSGADRATSPGRCRGCTAPSACPGIALPDQWTGGIDPPTRRAGSCRRALPPVHHDIHELKVLVPGARRVAAHALQLLVSPNTVQLRILQDGAVPAQAIERIQVVGNCARNLAKHRQVAGDDRAHRAPGLRPSGSPKPSVNEGNSNARACRSQVDNSRSLQSGFCRTCSFRIGQRSSRSVTGLHSHPRRPMTTSLGVAAPSCSASRRHRCSKQRVIFPWLNRAQNHEIIHRQGRPVRRGWHRRRCQGRHETLGKAQPMFAAIVRESGPSGLGIYDQRLARVEHGLEPLRVPSRFARSGVFGVADWNQIVREIKGMQAALAHSTRVARVLQTAMSGIDQHLVARSARGPGDGSANAGGEASRRSRTAVEEGIKDALVSRATRGPATGARYERAPRRDCRSGARRQC